MAAVPRASPRCGVKDEEVVAHYARTDGREPAVIQPGQLAQPIGRNTATTCIVRVRTTPAACDGDSRYLQHLIDEPTEAIATVGHAGWVLVCFTVTTPRNHRPECLYAIANGEIEKRRRPDFAPQRSPTCACSAIAVRDRTMWNPPVDRTGDRFPA